MVLFPLGDDNTDRHTTPLVNYALIAANIFVFVFFQRLGENEQFTYAYSCVPAEIAKGQDLEIPIVQIDPRTGRRVEVPGPVTPIPVYLTILTSMFMHGGLMHLAGNMLFLWVFGDNIENAMGHVRYIIFYLLGGVLATLAHVVFNTTGPSAMIPSLGASGAISAVLGGYILLFPHRRVRVLLFRFITDVPAIVAIGMWFVFQLVEGLGFLGGDSTGGGVAYAAHIGGFLAGLALVKPFMSASSNGASPIT
jgi:membrane associated rhomboid family serine protease